jgi:hypothetical protein
LGDGEKGGEWAPGDESLEGAAGASTPPGHSAAEPEQRETSSGTFEGVLDDGRLYPANVLIASTVLELMD